METKVWKFRDKPGNEERYIYTKEWPPGPWDDEPDKVQWEDPGTKLACLIVRNRMGAWCGYVGLPAGHPWREGSYDDPDVDVHGGLTYGPSPCSENVEGICHEVDNPEEDDVRWIGFDCNHGGDAAPGMMVSNKRMREERPDIFAKYDDLYEEDGYNQKGETYKDVAYVKSEVTALASQVDDAR